MAHRITWKSRPRSDYPWPLRTEDKPLSELGVGVDNPYEYLIGPLPLQAVVELLYRVVEIEAEISVTADFGSGVETTTDTLTIRLDDGGSTPDEVAVFSKPSTNEDGETTPSYPLLDAGEVNTFQPVDMLWSGFDVSSAPIFRDDSDPRMFWLQGQFEIHTTAMFEQSVSNGSPGFDDWILVDADLVLSSGTYPLKAFASSVGTISGASLTLTATEWHPYKTTAGSAAWDTSTGLAANGGPGA